MNERSWTGPAILGLSIGLGIMIAGLSVSKALYQVRATQRFVSVKGLAEREEDADLAIWPLTFSVAGNDLVDVHRRIDANREIIAAFLEQAGFKRSDISYSAPRISDAQAERNDGNRDGSRLRYSAQSTVTLRSLDVAGVKKTIEQSGTLVGKGLVLVQDWENRTQFLFTGLNKIKPGMIEEATLNAREAAAKFAKDSGSQVGKIRSATQGLFSITDRDPNSPDRKLVRVVTTVEYFLVDT